MGHKVDCILSKNKAILITYVHEFLFNDVLVALKNTSHLTFSIFERKKREQKYVKKALNFDRRKYENNLSF